MAKQSWWLDNAKNLQQANPYTFYKPSQAIIDRLKIGDIVKLIFCFDSDDPNAPGAERMWVIIKEVKQNGSFSGELDNDPFHIKDIKAGNVVIFNKEHIIAYDTLDELDVEEPQADLFEQYHKKCFVSNHILKEGYKVGRLYKEEPEYEDYTGWTIMSDHETQAYVDNSENLQYISIGKVLNIDDSFIHLLNEPVNSEFIRDEITGRFYKSEE